MTQVTYRANLSAKSFPFISEHFGRSVIVANQDQNFSRYVTATEDSDKDVGIPQAYYLHNVMPHSNGWQSIGYTSILPNFEGESSFERIFLLRDGSDNKIYLGVTSSGKFYTSDGTGAPWIYKQTNTSGALVTVAHVAGVSYVYVAELGCFQYNFITTTFDAVELAGLIASNILGITQAQGYLITWSKPIVGSIRSFDTSTGSKVLLGLDTSELGLNQAVSGDGIPEGAYITEIDPGVSVTISEEATATATVDITFKDLVSTVAWSSSLDPTDFVPSLTTGAGGGAVESAQGAINYCVTHTQGFIIGTANNCVAALYQNNARYPFQFREVVNSGGMTSLDLIGYDVNSTNLYVYTTSGLQLISTQAAVPVLPEITDFISGRYFEDFDDLTDTFSTVTLNTPLRKKLAVISDRYLVVSYGVTELTHAIVYDIALKRYGKFKLTHVQAFTYLLASPGILESPRQSLGFLKADGSVVTVDFSPSSVGLNGTLILGKYQYVRARLLQLDQVELESIRSGQNFDVKVLTTLDGKTPITSTPVLTRASGLTRQYSTRAIGVNISLLLKGGFVLDSVVLQFNVHGKR